MDTLSVCISVFFIVSGLILIFCGIRGLVNGFENYTVRPMNECNIQGVGAPAPMNACNRKYIGNVAPMRNIRMVL